MGLYSIGIDMLLGFLIGLTLGVLGGGGSILTVPALVYFAGQSPQAAVTASLMIVGANASIGAFFHCTQGVLNWRVALLFGGAGMAAAYFSAGLSTHMPPVLLLILFSLLMLAVGVWMIFSKPPAECNQTSRGWIVTAFSGVGVGVLTGFLGVGGGFLIVPALVMLIGLPMPQEIGTSLAVIAMNSVAGILGHLGSEPVDLIVVGTFVVAGILGSLAGVQLAKRIQQDVLRKGFAGLVILLAIFLLNDNIPKLPITGIRLGDWTMDLALLGGVLIGTAVTLLLAHNGRIAGIRRLVEAVLVRPNRGIPWRWLFLLGLPIGAIIYECWLAPAPTPVSALSPLAVFVCGMLPYRGAVQR